MESLRQILCALFFLLVAITKLRADELRNTTQNQKNFTTPIPVNLSDSSDEKINKTYNGVVVNNKGRRGGSYIWGWGGGGGGGGGGGEGGGRGGGWGWGGGGGGSWGWGCRKNNGRGKRHRNNRGKMQGKGEYIMGEFAQCMWRGRCKWKRLDCPLHCGGSCLYDCKHMCKAHCRRP